MYCINCSVDLFIVSIYVFTTDKNYPIAKLVEIPVVFVTEPLVNHTNPTISKRSFLVFIKSGESQFTNLVINLNLELPIIGIKLLIVISVIWLSASGFKIAKEPNSYIAELINVYPNELDPNRYNTSTASWIQKLYVSWNNIKYTNFWYVKKSILNL